MTDFAGRSVTYSYYIGDSDPDGSDRDLKSVTSPPVVPTDDFPIPPGHEFPGRTSTYTYTKGFDDELLNHNLLTITDGKGQRYLTNTYAATEDENDPLYGRVMTQEYGEGQYDYTYFSGLNPNDPANNGAVTKTIVNNRNGHVKELFYDAGHRLVIRRDYTGFADPAQPTTCFEVDDPSCNAPTGPSRPNDDPDFETRYEYNNDSLVTRMDYPNGNWEVFVYDEANGSRRSQGNLLSHCQFPGSLGGDQNEICRLYEYDDGFGGCCGFNFVTRAVDGLGNETLHEYDENGNRTRTVHRIPTIGEEWCYNEFGQVTKHVLPDNGSGHRRVDVFTYYTQDDDDQYGYQKEQVVDADAPETCDPGEGGAGGGFELTTTYEYDKVGNVIRVIDARGQDTLYTYNQLNNVIREESRAVTDGGTRYRRDSFYDGNNNIVRVDVQNVDHLGQEVPDNPYFTTIYEYDVLNKVTRVCQERGTDDVPVGITDCSKVTGSEFITTENAYDPNDNLVLTRHGEATNDNQPENVVRNLYDERDLLFRVIRAEGDPDQSTTQYDYDGNGNLTKTHEGLGEAPHITVRTYDGYNRLVSTIDPMGNVTTYHYDANRNRLSMRTDGQLVDVPGNAGNVRLYEADYEYDEMDRQECEIVEFFKLDDKGESTPIDDGQSITQTIYSDNSQVLFLIDDNNHETETIYDTANRQSVVIDAKGNTVIYDYDANSNAVNVTAEELSDLDPGGPPEVFETTYAYDNLDRLIQTVDNVGNAHAFAYDSRHNRTFVVDALSNETRYLYDGLNRLTQTIREVPEQADGQIATTQVWDDSSRRIARADDNGNTTTYVYDPLNRMTAEVYADQTVHTYEYDVHDNRTKITDANGTLVTSEYDMLDRVTRKDITVPECNPEDNFCVSDDTTFEIFEYDGVSRLVSAKDDDSRVTRRYDSLSNVIEEILTINPEQPNETSGRVTSKFDGVGNLRTCTYPSGRVIACNYDALDRKKAIQDETETPFTIATYAFVGPGRVARREYGNGTRTDYIYDGLVPDPNGEDFGVKRIIQTTHSVIADGSIIDDRTYTWDPMQNKTQRRDVRDDGPRLKHDYAYDAAYRLTHTIATDSEGAVLRDTTYDLDGVHNRNRVTTDPPDQGDGAYFMDPLDPPLDFPVNQYTAVPRNRREYDANGNLIWIGAHGDFDGNGAVDLDDYASFQSCLTGPGGTADFQCRRFDFDHDNDVDLVDWGAFQATFTGPDAHLPAIKIAYDYRNHMVEYADRVTGQRHTYAYDSFARRITKVVDADGVTGGPNQTRFFYGGQAQGQILEEQDDTGAPQATYVYGLYIDEVLNMQRGGTEYYYHSDDLYNVMAVTDADGNVVERYDYGDYGDPSVFDGLGIGIPQSEIRNPYLFTGRRFDPETGFYYYRTRYLNPIAGRFTTRDMIGIWRDAGNLGNGYGYVGNQPTSSVDPMGLDSPGCDYIVGVLVCASRCVLGCCAQHDSSYDEYDCAWWSWTWTLVPFIPSECARANRVVAVCLVSCINSERVSPGQDCYCRTRGFYPATPRGGEWCCD